MKRPNGTGCVVKLSGKRRNKYAARIATGKKITNSGQVATNYKYLGYFQTAKEAQELLDKYNGSEDERKKQKLVSPKSSPTFEKVYKETIEYMNGKNKTYSDSTYRALNAAYNNLSVLHHARMKNIDYEMLQTEITKSCNLSKSSLNNIRNLLKKMYTLSIKKEYVEKDISDLCDFEFTKAASQKHTPFTKEEILKIFNSPAEDSRDMLLILLYTGLRIQELLIMENKNIHLDEHYFTTGVKTAAGKERIIPIHDKIFPLIEERNKEDKFYFWDVGGSQRIYQTIRWRFDRYMEKLNMNHIPHDTRHSTATYLHESGINEMYIKLILGHHIEDLTQRVYIHSNPGVLVNEINKMRI